MSAIINIEVNNLVTKINLEHLAATGKARDAIDRGKSAEWAAALKKLGSTVTNFARRIDREVAP